MCIGSLDMRLEEAKDFHERVMRFLVQSVDMQLA